MVFNCIKLKLLQLTSSKFTRTTQSSLVNLINPNRLHAVVDATNRMVSPTPNTVKSMPIISSSKPHRLALSILTKFRKVSCVAILTMCLVLRVERVPFSNRRHLTFRSLPQRFLRNRSRKEAYRIVKEVKERFQGTRALPSRHEKSLRVASIASKLGQGMHDTLGLKKEFTIVAYELCNTSNPVWTVGRQSGQALRKSSFDSGTWFKRRYSTKHLEGAEWKITVIDSPQYNACLHSDKHIFVLTEMIDNCSDEELACVIGHEMGHAIARHKMESIIAGFIKYIFEAAIDTKIADYLEYIFEVAIPKILKEYSKRRQEFEADHIGMMLMASAGYDPRVALILLSRAQCEYPNDIPYSDDIHPCDRDRIEYLKNPERMKKATRLFRDYHQLHKNNLTNF